MIDMTPENPPILPRKWLTLNRGLTLYMAVVLGIAELTAGYLALTLVTENKREDAWAIMYLELERQGYQFLRQLERFPAADAFKELIPENGTLPSAAYLVDGQHLTLAAGALTGNPDVKDFDLDKNKFQAHWNFVSFAGEVFLAKMADAPWVGKIYNRPFSPGSYLLLWQVPFSRWLEISSVKEADLQFYAVSRSGKLLFSTNHQINPNNLLTRPLVRQFVTANMRQGQLQFRQPDGEDMFGFFYDLPSTNVVFFAETPRRAIMGNIYSLAGRYAIAFGALFILSLSILQIPLHRLSRKYQTIACWIIIAFFAQATPALAAPAMHSYDVQTFSGKVLYWAPWGAAWHNVETKMVLSPGTLVQVAPQSSVRLARRAAASTRPGAAKPVTLEVSIPMVFRLDDTMLREIKWTKQDVANFSAEPSVEADSVPKVKSFAEAWERKIAVLHQQAMAAFSGHAAQSAKKDSKAPVRKQIEFISPETEELLTEIPASLRLAWKAIDAKNPVFQIAIWKEGEAMPAPAVNTRLNFYTTEFAQEGVYHIQIYSQDQSWESDIRSVHVQAARKTESTSAQKLPLTRYIHLLFPPPNFVVYLHHARSPLTLTWEAPNTEGDRIYETIVQNELGREVFRKRTSERAVVFVPAEDGKFQWRVGVVSDDSQAHGSGDDRSQARQFEIRTAAPHETAIDTAAHLLGQYGGAKENRIVYIEDNSSP